MTRALAYCSRDTSYRWERWLFNYGLGGFIILCSYQISGQTQNRLLCNYTDLGNSAADQEQIWSKEVLLTVKCESYLVLLENIDFRFRMIPLYQIIYYNGSRVLSN